MTGADRDRAVQDALSGVSALAQVATTPTGAAAAKAANAALTLLLCSIRPSPVAGAQEAALRDLREAVAVLSGEDAGTDAIPARYDTGERETLDRIRDLLGDGLYVGGCLFNVLKYLDRSGKKGPASLDEDKALFYLQSAASVLFGFPDARNKRPSMFPDPRHKRPGFVPYSQKSTLWPTALLNVFSRLEAGHPTDGWSIEEFCMLIGKVEDLRWRSTPVRPGGVR